MHVSGERRVVCHDRLAANDTVMRDVHIGHDPVVVTDDRIADVLGRAAAERAKLADRVAVADDQAGRFVRVFLVLRIVTDRRELVDMIVLADFRRTVDDHVTIDACAAADLNCVADDRVGPDLDIVGDDRSI